MSASLIKVALPVPLRRLFDYLPPVGITPASGSRVLVPFGKRELVGLVVGQGEADGNYDPAKLQRIKRLLDEEPILPPSLLALCQQAASYYHQPIGEMFACALPVLLRQGQTTDSASESVWRLTERGQFVLPEQFKSAHRQRAAWEALQQRPQGLSAQALKLLEVQRPALNALAGKGWAEEVVLTQAATPKSLLAEPPLAANAEQQAAIDAITAAHGYQGFLLDGVTGSGKTEVYLQAVEKVLAEGKQALILVPEIGLTPQTLQRVEQRFNRSIGCLHSGLTDRQRLAVWEDARHGKHAIIMGTRSALFTPLAAPGLIIVDEAHDTSFRQQDGCRYNARDLALLRGQLEQVPVVLGSATPSLESLQLVQQQRLISLPLRQRAQSVPPVMQLQDTRQLPAQQLLTDASRSAIADCLAAGQQALVFLNRRGYAPLISCLNCGWQMECPHCDRFMTWHKQARRLICHHCDRQSGVPQRCPSCGSSQLGDMGAGTEKLEERLQALFPDHPVIRIDRDSVRRKGSLEEKFALIHQGRAAILTGTQMLAKGHHFPNLALTVILEADTGFLSADFRGAEQAGQLILQVAGRTGRGKTPGKVLIQTRHPDLDNLKCLIQGDWHQFSAKLLAERSLTGLPPFGHAALLSAEAVRETDARALLDAARQALPSQQALMALGPVAAPMEKRAGRFRQQLLLLGSNRAGLHQSLAQLLPLLETLPEARRCRWQIDVDPIDML